MNTGKNLDFARSIAYAMFDYDNTQPYSCSNRVFSVLSLRCIDYKD